MITVAYVRGGSAGYVSQSQSNSVLLGMLCTVWRVTFRFRRLVAGVSAIRSDVPTRSHWRLSGTYIGKDLVCQRWHCISNVATERFAVWAGSAEGSWRPRTRLDVNPATLVRSWRVDTYLVALGGQGATKIRLFSGKTRSR